MHLFSERLTIFGGMPHRISAHAQNEQLHLLESILKEV
jgi:hypothetical protein